MSEKISLDSSDVVYIEANTNSYVMYTSNRESGTPVPPDSE